MTTQKQRPPTGMQRLSQLKVELCYDLLSFFSSLSPTEILLRGGQGRAESHRDISVDVGSNLLVLVFV